MIDRFFQRILFFYDILILVVAALKLRIYSFTNFMIKIKIKKNALL